MYKKYAYQLITILLVSAGLFGALTVSYKTVTGSNPCPNVWIMPICYIVLMSYTTVFISLFIKSKVLFYSGWLPVFMFAAVGAALEATQGSVCPRAQNIIPMCYVSLVLAVAIFGLYFFSANRFIKSEQHISD